MVRSDGTPIRDYLFVEDAVTGYLALAEQLSVRPELAGECFNFSDEHPLSVLALVEEIRKAVGSALEPLVQNEASGEIAAQYLDSPRRANGWAGGLATSARRRSRRPSSGTARSSPKEPCVERTGIRQRWTKQTSRASFSYCPKTKWSGRPGRSARTHARSAGTARG